MAKKAAGKKNHPAEILDDNGTLIATSDGPVAVGGGAGRGKASTVSDKRGIPELS
ncbi:MAG TPA: hypothetical protein VF548_07095 [Allosphingosinicella sp.]|jgi:hypothetical protein